MRTAALLLACAAVIASGCGKDGISDPEGTWVLDVPASVSRVMKNLDDEAAAAPDPQSRREIDDRRPALRDLWSKAVATLDLKPSGRATLTVQFGRAGLEGAGTWERTKDGVRVQVTPKDPAARPDAGRFEFRSEGDALAGDLLGFRGAILKRKSP